MNTVKSTQIFTVFGGEYVSENHGAGLFFVEKGKVGAAKWIAVACLLAWGVSTATAISKFQTPASDYSWSQPSTFFKSPFSGGIEISVY